MSSITFQPVTSIRPEDRACLICFEIMDAAQGNVMAHRDIARVGEDGIHPFHRECLIRALAISRLCPLCRLNCDIDLPPRELRDRIVDLTVSMRAFMVALVENPEYRREAQNLFIIALFSNIAIIALATCLNQFFNHAEIPTFAEIATIEPTTLIALNALMTFLWQQFIFRNEERETAEQRAVMFISGFIVSSIVGVLLAALS